MESSAGAIAFPLESYPSNVKFAVSPAISTLLVKLLGGGPGLYCDIATFNFQGATVPFGQFRLPDTVKFVRLRPARGVLDIPGVDQLHVQAASFEQVEPDPPVVACGLQGDLFDPLDFQTFLREPGTHKTLIGADVDLSAERDAFPKCLWAFLA